MEVNNPKYNNQGIHVISTIFTIDKGVTKVLLIKRKNNPYKDYWALVGGALYNDELLIDGMKREIKEKIGINNIYVEQFGLFDKIDRSPLKRMIAVGYIGIVDKDKLEILKDTLKTSDSDWYPIDMIPTLAYDHNIILNEAIDVLKKRLNETDLLSNLYPNGFTMPEIQKIYESILDVKFDRRNFRKKLLSLDIIEETNKVEKFDGNKPAKIYKFKDNKKKNVL